jgi:hypothetical protein
MKMDRPMSSSACKGLGAGGALVSAPSSSSSQHKRSHTAPAPSPPLLDKFCDDDFFTEGNFELAEKFALASEDELLTPAPPGSCPSSARGGGQAHHRGSKRTPKKVDLGKGIATTRKKGAQPPQPSRKGGEAGVNEDTLRLLSREGVAATGPAALLLQQGGAGRDDWSRTVEALRQKNPPPPPSSGVCRLPPPATATSEENQQQQQQQRANTTTFEAQREDVPRRGLASSPSKEDFLSIMSSITDVEL